MLKINKLGNLSFSICVTVRKERKTSSRIYMKNIFCLIFVVLTLAVTNLNTFFCFVLNANDSGDGSISKYLYLIYWFSIFSS